MSRKEITVAVLNEYLKYDEKSGVFYWRKRPKKSIAAAGMRAGLAKNGYIQIPLGEYGYCYGHRAAWAMTHGSFPEEGMTIDHVNSNGLDNRLSNLRLATPAQNGANRGKQRNNTSGYKGVSLVNGRYMATLAGKYIGSFSTPEEAHAAYCDKAKQVHGEFFNSGELKVEVIC